MATPTIANQAPAAYLGLPSNPLEDVLRRNQSVAAQQRFQQEQDLAKKKLRDEQWTKAMEVEDPEYWKELSGEVLKAKEEVTNFYIDKMASGLDPNDPRVQKEGEKLKNKFQNVGNQSINYKKTMDEAMDILGVGKTWNDHYKPEAKSYVWDAWFDSDSKFKGFDKADRNEVQRRLSDPAYFHMPAIARDFVADLPEHVYSYYEPIYNKLGEQFDRTTLKSQLIELDGNNMPVINPVTKMPYMKLNEHTMAAAKADPKIARYLDWKTEDITDLDKKLQEQDKILRDILAPHVKVSITQEPTSITKPPVPRDGGDGSPWDSIEIEASVGKDIANYEDVRDGVAGYQAIFAPTPGIIKDAYLGASGSSSMKVDVEGFGVDSTGAPYVLTTSRVSGDRVKEARFPFDDTTRKAIRNTMKKPADRLAYDGFVKRFDQAVKKNKQLEVDETLLNQTIENIISKPVPELIEGLKDAGIPVNINRDSHYPWVAAFKPGKDYVEINDQRFYPENAESREQMKKYIFDNFKEQFVRVADEKKEKPTEVEFKQEIQNEIDDIFGN